MPTLRSWRGDRFVRTRGVPVEDADLNDGLAWAIAQAQAGGGEVSLIEKLVENLVMPASVLRNEVYAQLLYQVTDPADLSNLLMLSVVISYEDVIGSKFTYDLFSGEPGQSGSKLLVSAGQDFFFTSTNRLINSSATAYLSNANLRTGLWIRFTNRLTSPLRCSAKLQFLELPPLTDPVDLPAFNPTPFVYTGPAPLSECDVGPGQTFPEMRDAINYMAGAFTMRVHAGQYFKPMLIPRGRDGFVIKPAPGVTPDQIVCNGRGGWVTGKPFWVTNNPATVPPENPFRLSGGKGFIRCFSPGTIEGLSFTYSGGAYGIDDPDNVSDAEAGIYAEDFAVPGTLNIVRCRFDGNENGIFTPLIGGPGTNVSVFLDHCDFSMLVPNGQAPDGLSHNTYVNGPEVVAVGCNFFGCYANSFKSRSPVLHIYNCYLESWRGRCVDFPDGGEMVIANSRLAQHPTEYPVTNFLGVANEFQTNGDGRCDISGCTIDLYRYDTIVFMLGETTYVDFAPDWGRPSTFNWHVDYDPIGVRFGYAPGGNQSGIRNAPGSPEDGGTIVHGRTLTRPGSCVSGAAFPVLFLVRPITPGAPFVLDGALAGYAAVPTLSLSIDGGAWTALPAGSLVSRFRFSIPADGITAARTFQVRDAAGVVSDTVTVAPPPPPVVRYGAQASGSLPLTIHPDPAYAASITILINDGNVFVPVFPSISPTNIRWAFGPGTTPPPPSVGNSGSAAGSFVVVEAGNYANATDASSGLVFAVRVAESVDPAETWRMWLLMEDEYSVEHVVTVDAGFFTFSVQVGDDQSDTYS